LLRQVSIFYLPAAILIFWQPTSDGIMSSMTTQRMTNNNARNYDEEIAHQIERNIQYFRERPEEIESRLSELEQEWDIECTMEAYTGAFSLGGAVLGLFSRKWLLFPALAGGFMLQHATQGWCPPMQALRRMGVRTRSEIEYERNALRTLRGDFEYLSINQNVREQSERTYQRPLEAVNNNA
jgi:hypothetical protein